MRRVKPTIRRVDAQDAYALASIHAASWRSAYRGMLRDDFLDGDLVRNRLALWTKRLGPVPEGHFGYVAHTADEPTGFAFAFGAHDPEWGTQIDNLHVLPSERGRGLGKQLLLNLVTQASLTYPDEGLYLWVYEKNDNARRFYEALHGEAVGRVVIEAPGGGELAEWRYVWRQARSLLGAIEGDAKHVAQPERQRQTILPIGRTASKDTSA